MNNISSLYSHFTHHPLFIHLLFHQVAVCMLVIENFFFLFRDTTTEMFIVAEFTGKHKYGKPKAAVVSSAWIKNCREVYWPPFVNPFAIIKATKNHILPHPKTWTKYSFRTLYASGKYEFAGCIGIWYRLCLQR